MFQVLGSVVSPTQNIAEISKTVAPVRRQAAPAATGPIQRKALITETVERTSTCTATRVVTTGDTVAVRAVDGKQTGTWIMALLLTHGEPVMTTILDIGNAVEVLPADIEVSREAIIGAAMIVGIRT